MMVIFLLSGWQDSNLRPSGPKPDALTGLRYTPFYTPKLSLTSEAESEVGSEGVLSAVVSIHRDEGGFFAAQKYHLFSNFKKDRTINK